MHEGVVAARVLARKILADVEVLDLTGDARRKSACIEARNRGNAGARTEYVRPRGRNADPNRGHDAQPGYDDAASGHGVCHEGLAKRPFFRPADDGGLPEPVRGPAAGARQGRSMLFLEMRADVVDCLLHSGDLLCVLVGNLGFELFFQRHDELDRIQRIRTEVVHERRLVLYFGLVDAQLLGDDLLDSLLYVFHASPPLAGCERSKAGDFTRTGAFSQSRGLSSLIAPARKTRFLFATAY